MTPESCSAPVSVRFEARRRRRARHLDREHVVVAEAGQIGDVERVGEEVPLGIAEVGAVEPDVGLVDHAVEHHEHPLVVGG
jgi:hypothetical protein